MSFPQGINFRQTAAFVTDPTNYASETDANSTNGVNYPTTTPQGNTVGWETAGFNVISTRDRSAAVDVRVAGINFIAAGSTATYRIDLPATGNYGIQAAFGDQGSAQGPFTIQFKDTTTVFATPVSAASTSASDDYYAANGTQEIGNSAWATNNPNAGSGADEITHTFSSTIFRITGSGSGIPLFASIFIRSASAAFTAKFRRTLSSVGIRVGSRQAQAA